MDKTASTPGDTPATPSPLEVRRTTLRQELAKANSQLSEWQAIALRT